MLSDENYEKICFAVGKQNYIKIINGIKNLPDMESFKNMEQVANTVYKRLEKKHKDKALLKELCRFSSFSDTDEEKELLRKRKLDYCVKCGWCCSNLNIRIYDNERERLIGEGVPDDFFKVYFDDWCFVHVPCLLMDKDNKCEVYNIRPVGCKGYPLTRRYDGSSSIAKTPHCEFVLRLVERKVLMYLENINVLEQYNEAGNKLEGV